MSEIKFIVHPIGFIKTPYKTKYGAPRQPASSSKQTVGTITLDKDMNFEQALEDLEGFEYIWIVFWLHLNMNWKPKVLPPNSGRIKRGLFSTRSPHRPNPLGLSLCKLLSVKGRVLKVENPDMIDGTPILDIKPYIPHAEAIPEARAGWLSELNELTKPQFTVSFAKSVINNFKNMNEGHGEIFNYVEDLLSRDPFPHVYRRIKIKKDGTSILAVKRWRFTYKIIGTKVAVTDAAYVGNQ